MDGKDCFLRIRFRLPLPDWHGFETETLWAAPLGERAFRIESIPFYIKGVSRGDLVLAKKSSEVWEFDRILLKSGHSTYRIALTEEKSSSQAYEYISYLRSCDLEVEQAPIKFPFFAVDVPPQFDLDKIYLELSNLEVNGVFAFEEGDCCRSDPPTMITSLPY